MAKCTKWLIAIINYLFYRKRHCAIYIKLKQGRPCGYNFKTNEYIYEIDELVEKLKQQDEQAGRQIHYYTPDGIKKKEVK